MSFYQVTASVSLTPSRQSIQSRKRSASFIDATSSTAKRRCEATTKKGRESYIHASWGDKLDS